MVLLNKIFEFLKKQELQNFFPKICSEYFKVFNKEYKVNSKTIVLTIQGLEKLILKSLEKKNSSSKPDFLLKFKNLVSSENSSEKEAKNDPFIKISNFLETLYRNLEKNKYNNKIAETFMHFVIETIEIFIDTPVFQWTLLTYLYFNNSSIENNESEMNLLYSRLSSQNNVQIMRISSFLKEEFLFNLKSLEKLHLCVDSQVFLKTFRILKNSSHLLNLQFSQKTESFKELRVFSYNDIENVGNVFLKVFCVKPMKMTKIETIDQFTNISLFKNSLLEKQFIQDSEEITFQFLRRKIIDNFEIINFDENILALVNEMFGKLEISLAIHLFEIYFNKLAEARFSFENKGEMKTIVSMVFLANQCLGRMINFSIFNRKWLEFMNTSPTIQVELDSILIKYVDLLLGFDYLPIEDMRDSIEFKTLFEIMKIEGLFKSFLLTNIEHQTIFLHKFNILYYILEKYVENDALIKILIEKNLAYFMYFVEHEKNIADFLNKYIENIIKRVILQIRSVHILENKMQPFKVFEALLVMIQNDENSISMFHLFCMDVWLTLIKFFDKYYIISEFRFIHLFLKITQQIMKILGKKPKEIEKNEDNNFRYNEINLIRQILLRIKPLVLSKNNEIMVLANEIFKDSLILIHGIFNKFIIFKNLVYRKKNGG